MKFVRLLRITSLTFLTICLIVVFSQSQAIASKVLLDDLKITTDPNDQSQPDVAYDTVNNRYFVVWTDSRNPSGSDIYGRLVQFGASTGVNTATTLIDASKNWTVNEYAGARVVITSGTGVGQERTIASNTANILTVTAVWTAVPDTSSQYAIVGNEAIICNAAGNQTQPKVAFDDLSATKRFLVIWTDTRSGAGRIFGQFVNTDGNPDAQGNFQISQSVDPALIITYESEMSPSLIFNSVTQKFSASWLDATNSEQTYTYTTSIICGLAGTAQTFVYLPATVADTLLVRSRDITYADVQAAAQPDGSKLTGTKTDRSKFYFIDPFTENQICSITQNSLTLKAKFLTMNSESTPVITYNPTDGSIYNVWSGKGLTSSLSVTWSRDCQTVVKDAQGNPVSCAAWWAFVQTGPVYTSSGDSNPVAYGRMTRLGLTNDIALSDTTKPSYNPSVSADPDNNKWLATWETQDSCADPTTDTCKNIYGQLIDMQNYLQYGSMINISQGPSDQTQPKVAFDRVNQRYLTIWEDARSSSASISNIDIFGQFIDPQGRPSGANFPITVSPGNQISPSLSFGDVDSRRFLITWKDGRVSSDANVFGQLWEFSVAPQLLVTDESNVQIYNQALDFGGVDVNFTSKKKFRIWNNGNSQLTISSITSPDLPFTLLTSKPTTISPGVFYEMEVQFAPMAGGSFAGNSANNYKIQISSDGGTMVLYLSGNGANTVSLSVTTASLPDAGALVSYSQTLAGVGGTAPYVWSLATGSLPLPGGLTINSATGVISGIPLAAGTYPFTAQVTDTNGAGTSATRNLSIKVTSVGVTTASLATWTQGVSGYNQTLAATGGAPPYTWASTAGTMPTGLSISAAGVITGTPTDAGSFSFTAQVTDTTPSSGTKDLSISINPTPSIITTSLPDGEVNALYPTTSIAVAGGTSPLSWSKTSGSLPPGIALNTGSGQLTGTPSASGSYTFTIQVKDAIQTQQNAAGVSKSFTITIKDLVNITTTAPTAGSKGSFYSQTISTSSSGLPPFTWSIVSGTLPDGLALAPATGVISGTPTASGTFAFTAQVQDSAGTKSQKTLSIQVADASSSSSSGGSSSGSAAASGGGGGGGGGGGCFIATAAFGSYLDPHVVVLREFRDRFLLTNFPGTVFVKLYYAYSPHMAAYMETHKSLKPVVRALLTPLIFSVEYPIQAGAVFFGLIVFGLAPLRRRNREK